MPSSGTSPLAPPTQHSQNYFHNQQRPYLIQQEQVSQEQHFVVSHAGNRQPAVQQSVSYTIGPSRPEVLDEVYQVDPKLREVGKIFDGYSKFVEENLNHGAADVSWFHDTNNTVAFYLNIPKISLAFPK